MGEHMPCNCLPPWTECKECGEPWPCKDAQLDKAREKAETEGEQASALNSLLRKAREENEALKQRLQQLEAERQAMRDVAKPRK